MAAAVGLSAYWTALASRPVEPAPPARELQPVPGLVPIHAGTHDADVAARDRAYRRGRRAGLREGRRAATRRLGRRLGGFARWDGAYLVTSSRDGRGIRTRVPLKPGTRYELCRDGKAVCATRRD